MSETGRNRRSRWTDVLLTTCGLFVLTVLLIVATAFNPKAALMAQFFDRHGLTVLAVEVGAILIVAIIVFVVERRESRQRALEQAAAGADLPGGDLLEPGSRESAAVDDR
jgi:heme/copper-type cytochrome/quinol oxidase subunit 2